MAIHAISIHLQTDMLEPIPQSHAAVTMSLSCHKCNFGLPQRVEIVLTAHPTQVNRRTLQYKHTRIATLLAQNDRCVLLYLSLHHHETGRACNGQRICKGLLYNQEKLVDAVLTTGC